MKVIDCGASQELLAGNPAGARRRARDTHLGGCQRQCSGAHRCCVGRHDAPPLEGKGRRPLFRGRA